MKKMYDFEFKKEIREAVESTLWTIVENEELYETKKAQVETILDILAGIDIVTEEEWQNYKNYIECFIYKYIDNMIL